MPSEGARRRKSGVVGAVYAAVLSRGVQLFATLGFVGVRPRVLTVTIVRSLRAPCNGPAKRQIRFRVKAKAQSMPPIAKESRAMLTAWIAVARFWQDGNDLTVFEFFIRLRLEQICLPRSTPSGVGGLQADVDRHTRAAVRRILICAFQTHLMVCGVHVTITVPDASRRVKKAVPAFRGSLGIHIVVRNLNARRCRSGVMTPQNAQSTMAHRGASIDQATLGLSCRSCPFGNDRCGTVP